MSKRGAERQLTDRDRDGDDDDDEGSESGPFAAAAPEVVATRQIRGLPARKAAAAPAPAPAATKNPFGGSPGGAFGGFGSTAPASNPFAPVQSTAPASSSSGSAPSSGASSPFSSFSFGAGSAPAATAIAPTFSFPSTKTAAAAPSNTFPGAPAFSFPTTKAPSSGPPVLTYYMSLRSLNLSYLDALKAQVEKDPFFKINALAGPRGSLDERYEKHWQEVTTALELSKGKGKGKAPAPAAKAVDKGPAPFISIEVTPPVPDVTMAAPEPTLSTSVASAAAPPAPFVPIPFNWAAATGGSAPEPVVAAPPAPPKFSLPAPPTGAFKWGDMDVPKPSTSAAPVTGGFVLKPIEADPYAEKSAFTFPPAAAATVPVPVPSTVEVKKSAESTKPTAIAIPPAVAKLANAPASPSPLRQAQSVSPPAEQPSSFGLKDAATVPKAAFSFGATFGGIAKGDSSSSTPVDAPKAKSSAFSFGSAATPPTASATPSLSFGSGTAPKPIASNPFTAGASSTAFGFGTPSQPKAIQKPLGSPPITTSFGTGASPPTFGFGAALASKPPPAQPFAAGFSFGVSSTTPAPSTSVPAKVTTGFSFGAAPAPPAVVSEPMSAASSLAGGSTTGEDTAPEGVDLPVQASGLTGRGEGEEGEKVLHEVRAKVWDFKAGDWHERGVAVVSIKEREDDGKKRILARNAVNGNVLINFRLQPGMAVKMEKTFLTFMGFEGTTPMNFRLRIKTPADTAEMQSQLEAHAGPKE